SALQNGTRENPRLLPFPPVIKLHERRPVRVSVGTLARAENPAVIGNHRPPRSVVAVDPSARSPHDAEAVGANVLHRDSVPDLDRARHRLLRVVGMRSVEFAVHNYAAVEMNEGSAFRTFPL